VARVPEDLMLPPLQPSSAMLPMPPVMRAKHGTVQA